MPNFSRAKVIIAFIVPVITFLPASTQTPRQQHIIPVTFHDPHSNKTATLNAKQDYPLASGLHSQHGRARRFDAERFPF